MEQIKKLTLGYSPCPNDTFIFYALTHGRIKAPGLRISEILEDVETLNRKALAAELDLTKVSFHAFAHLREQYCMLRSGGALGRGCGPLVVSKDYSGMDELKGRRIAIPGRYTTAYLLLMLYDSGLDNILIMPFDRIMPAVASGEADAGLIIHEGRFTYRSHGLRKLLDLGEYWESETGLPIPLGCILAKRSLGKETVFAAEKAIRESIEYAYANREETKSYIRCHAQELDDEVTESHIALYVNNFSLDIGNEGIRAVETLFARAASAGVLPVSDKPLFI